MKVVMAQINSVVGDFQGNFDRMSRVLRTAGDADLVVFPECALCGYPQQDLLDYKSFAETAEIFAHRLSKENPKSNFIFGSVEKNREVGKPLRNTAYVSMNGQIVHRYFKRLLPTYDVFDEDRFFEPGRSVLEFELLGKKISVTICEDIWGDDSGTSLHNRYSQNPVQESEAADLIVNLSASPFEFEKVDQKKEMLRRLASRHEVSLIYVNSVGANDGLIFDGRSYWINYRGEILKVGKAFEEDIIDCDLFANAHPLPQASANSIQDIYDALKLGIKDYCAKTGFSSVILGMSGGIDSSLTACLAADALGPENVVGVLLPSRFTSRESNEDALGLARAMQNPIHLIPIELMFSSGVQSLSQAFENLEQNITEENLQSRIRGTLLMALSNKFGHLLLTTGNKSELAVGYCTLYGDMNGGLAPLSDVYKTQVYELSREANRRAQRIPERVFTKHPSAELRPDQRDQDTLPEYKRLDEILKLILEKFETKETIVKKGYETSEVEKIFKWISMNEFKRFQMPLGLKISSKAFGVGRRIPLVHRFF